MGGLVAKELVTIAGLLAVGLAIVYGMWSAGRRAERLGAAKAELSAANKALENQVEYENAVNATMSKLERLEAAYAARRALESGVSAPPA